MASQQQKEDMNLAFTPFNSQQVSLVNPWLCRPPVSNQLTINTPNNRSLLPLPSQQPLPALVNAFRQFPVGDQLNQFQNQRFYASFEQQPQPQHHQQHLQQPQQHDQWEQQNNNTYNPNNRFNNNNNSRKHNRGRRFQNDRRSHWGYKSQKNKRNWNDESCNQLPATENTNQNFYNNVGLPKNHRFGAPKAPLPHTDTGAVDRKAETNVDSRDDERIAIDGDVNILVGADQPASLNRFSASRNVVGDSAESGNSHDGNEAMAKTYKRIKLAPNAIQVTVSNGQRIAKSQVPVPDVENDDNEIEAPNSNDAEPASTSTSLPSPKKICKFCTICKVRIFGKPMDHKKSAEHKNNRKMMMEIKANESVNSTDERIKESGTGWTGDVEVAEWHLKPLTGLFCRVCKVYYGDPNRAKKHCRSLTHYQNHHKLMQEARNE